MGTRQDGTYGSPQSLSKSRFIGCETKNAQERRKKKGKDKRNTEFEPKEEFYPSDEASGSKKEKNQRFDKGKCSYYKKGNHTEKYCMKNTIYQVSKLLDQHNISLPGGIGKDDSRDTTKDHDERCHALKASCSKSHAFLIDSGASNHMVASRESLSLLQTTDGMIIIMGDDT